MKYEVIGTVIHGKKLGRMLGFPTANISFRDDTLDSGVYASNIVFEGKLYQGVSVYTGKGTSFGKKFLLETYIFEFSENIYERDIEVILLEKIRDNTTFVDHESLSSQLHHDIKVSQKLYFPVLTFGSFDIFHAGHRHYLEYAKKYSRTLITIIARDETITQMKGKQPYYDEVTRKNIVSDEKISDVVTLGDTENPFVWIEKYKPKLIMLGYDQGGNFVDLLPQRLIEYGLSSAVIFRAPSLSPEIYKSSKLRGVQS